VLQEGTPQYGGVVVYSMADVPLGFGVAAQPVRSELLTHSLGLLCCRSSIVNVTMSDRVLQRSGADSECGSPPGGHRRVPASGGRTLLRRPTKEIEIVYRL
jgi:hypothetical protein